MDGRIDVASAGRPTRRGTASVRSGRVRAGRTCPVGWLDIQLQALVAQGIEHRFPKPCVAGSIPAGGTQNMGNINRRPAGTRRHLPGVSISRSPVLTGQLGAGASAAAATPELTSRSACITPDRPVPLGIVERHENAEKPAEAQYVGRYTAEGRRTSLFRTRKRSVVALLRSVTATAMIRHSPKFGRAIGCRAPGLRRCARRVRVADPTPLVSTATARSSQSG